MADDFVPVEAEAGFDQQAVRDAPAIFGVDADFGVVLLMRRSGGEGGVASAGERRVLGGVEAGFACRQRRLGGGEKRNWLARELSIVGDAVEIDSDFEIVTAVPLVWWKVEIGEKLEAAGSGCSGGVVTAVGGVGIDVVGKCSVGSDLDVVLIEGESGFEELASSEVVLIFDAGDVGGLDIFWIRELRALRRQECVLVVQVVYEEAAGQDVAGG